MAGALPLFKSLYHSPSPLGWARQTARASPVKSVKTTPSWTILASNHRATGHAPWRRRTGAMTSGLVNDIFLLVIIS